MMVAPYRPPTDTVKRFRYFVASFDWDLLADTEGRILVFRSKAKAYTYGKRCPALADGHFIIVQLSETRWKMFKRTEKYRLVKESQ